MVKKKKWKGQEIFICESCSFGYKTRQLAQKCENYCVKNHSCSLEITKHAVKTS